jgi:hypothetical protein
VIRLVSFIILAVIVLVLIPQGMAESPKTEDAAEAPAAALLDVAPPELKTIELEWESQDNADGYEVRLTPEGGKPIFFRTFESKLSEEVPVGIYSLRIRSRHKESKDIWSPWSDAIRLEVLKKELLLLEPPNETTLFASNTARQEVEFKWTEIPKAKSYTLSIWTEETKEKPVVFVTKKTSQRLKLLPSQVYFWQVTFESATAVSYVQVVRTNMFTMQGPKLVKPSITPFKPGEERIALSWISSKKAQTYDAVLSYRHLDETEWSPQRDAKLDTGRWEFGKLKPGAYKLEVVAHAPKHASSDKGTYEFIVKPSREELERKMIELASGLQ